MSKAVTTAGKVTPVDKNKTKRDRLVALAAELRGAKSDEAAADALEAIMAVAGD